MTASSGSQAQGRDLQIIVLAAGKGTRMRSEVPKVLHRVAGLSMLGHVLKLAQSLGPSLVSVVIGPGMDDVRAEAERLAPGVRVFTQDRQMGTAHAVLAARPSLEGYRGRVLVLYADTPLLTVLSLEATVETLERGVGIAVLGFEAADPSGYGRLLTGPGGQLMAIREHKDASPAELAQRLCNSGVMGFAVADLPSLLDAIGNSNAKGEFYLTDAVEIWRRRGGSAEVVRCGEEEVLGVNSRAQLALAEAVWQRRRRFEVMAGGATLVAPETVFFAHDTVIGQDVLIEPHVVFGPGVSVGDGAEIKSFSYMEGARIGDGARIGPFARLRPGADIGADAHIGNFVEVKNVAVGPGAKANHLSYLGDGSVGAGANIGAGTIFCNYDGFNKTRTDVGPGAFIGSNTSLVAPVKIGEGAYVGSGSVITKDVAPGALALGRSPQEERPEWATKFRTMMGRRKAKLSEGAKS